MGWSDVAARRTHYQLASRRSAWRNLAAALALAIKGRHWRSVAIIDQRSRLVARPGPYAGGCSSPGAQYLSQRTDECFHRADDVSRERPRLTGYQEQMHARTDRPAGDEGDRARAQHRRRRPKGPAARRRDQPHTVRGRGAGSQRPGRRDGPVARHAAADPSEPQSMRACASTVMPSGKHIAAELAEQTFWSGRLNSGRVRRTRRPRCDREWPQQPRPAARRLFPRPARAAASRAQEKARSSACTRTDRIPRQRHDDNNHAHLSPRRPAGSTHQRPYRLERSSSISAWSLIPVAIFSGRRPPRGGGPRAAAGRRAALRAAMSTWTPKGRAAPACRHDSFPACGGPAQARWPCS